MSKSTQCPFSIGDLVRFTPSDRTKGLYQDLERFGVGIGQEVVITEIKDGIYLYFEGGRGGLPWNEYSSVVRSDPSGTDPASK
jgi:hypothetical protein